MRKQTPEEHFAGMTEILAKGRDNLTNQSLKKANENARNFYESLDPHAQEELVRLVVENMPALPTLSEEELKGAEELYNELTAGNQTPGNPWEGASTRWF